MSDPLKPEKNPETVTVETLKQRGWRVDPESGKWDEREPCIELRTGSVIKGVPFDEARGLAAGNLVKTADKDAKPNILLVYDPADPGAAAARKAKLRESSGVSVRTASGATDQNASRRIAELEAKLADLTAKFEELAVIDDPEAPPETEGRGKKK